MKHFFLTMTAIICMLGFNSCAGQKATGEGTTEDEGTQVYTFKDSCQHLIVSLSLSLPLGKDSIGMQIRDSLIADFILNVNQPVYGEDDDWGIPPYKGDNSDAQAIVDHYGREVYDYLLKLAQSDYEERMQYLKEDSTITEEEKKSIMADVPQWAYDLSITKVTDTQRFVVYQSQAYIYCGGAHGGITGTGALTFDTQTGKKIGRFVKADAASALQPLIRKGLRQYYAEYGDTITDGELSERLQIQDTMIPLPQDAEYPNATADSLIFTYGQYEIACYADGMPSFKLSVKDLMPYLTPEGKALFETSNLPK